MDIPTHVPAALVRQFDFTDMQGEADFYQRYKKLHDGPDIFYTPHNGGHWVATRYADMEAIIANSNDFSSQYSSLPKSPFRILLLESDQPIHTEYRRLMAPFFTPKYVGNLEKNAEKLTNLLIDAFHANGECDFTRDFSQKLPIIILMSLLDLDPADQIDLLQISDAMVRSTEPDVLEAAFLQLAEYVKTKVIPARRAKPGNDLFSAMLEGQVECGRFLSDNELVNLGCLMIAAGVETVASMLGFIAMFLADNPGHRRQLIDNPLIIKPALQELMRRFHITNSSRVAKRDMQFNGIEFKSGDIVQLLTTIAGLDERRYPDPLTVDFARQDTRHLVFGRGPHQCIGSLLARTELRVFLAEWLRRIPEFRIKRGETPVVVPGKTCGVRYLPLAWRIAGGTQNRP